jgi:acetyltransferase-like isoleucine patch superfamily enzyme
MGEIKQLTGLRFIAAFYVFMFHMVIRGVLPHFPGSIKSILGQGALGVNVFFVLSGFLLAYSHIKDFEPGYTPKRDCNICDHCFTESGVVLGNNVTLKCGIYLWNGTTLEDNVFAGPNVVFTNDVHPRSKNRGYNLRPVLVRKGASPGANSTILAGITVRRYASVGIGAVVTRDVPDYALVYGNPARQHGWVDETGEKLLADGPDCWHSVDGQRTCCETDRGLHPKD